MFEKRNQVGGGERAKGHDGEEYEGSPQDASALLMNCVETLISKAVGRDVRQIHDGLKALHTQLLQAIVKLHAMSELLDDKLAPFRTQLTKIEAGQQQINYSLERIAERQEQLTEESKLLESASRRNQLLANEHYENHVIQPMVRSLIPTLDYVEDARDGIPGRGEDGDERIQELTEGVLIQLGQFLSAYGVEPIQHRAGAKFDPTEMKSVKTVTTHDKRLDKYVAKSLQAGFRGPQQRLLRPESVVLYKYCEPSMKSNKQRRNHETGIRSRQSSLQNGRA
jgi:molecular chaperone GrpE (heat shock protein)